MLEHNKESSFNPLMKEATREVKFVSCTSCGHSFRVAFLKMGPANREHNYIYCPKCNKSVEVDNPGVIIKELI